MFSSFGEPDPNPKSQSPVHDWSCKTIIGYDRLKPALEEFCLNLQVAQLNLRGVKTLVRDGEVALLECRVREDN